MKILTKFIFRVMGQLNEHSKDQANMVFKQGEVVNSIEGHVTDAKANMDTAVIHIKDANELNKSTGGMLNKVVYLVIIIVVLLVLLSWIMPK